MADHVEIRETDGELDIVRRPTGWTRFKSGLRIVFSGSVLIVAFLAFSAIYEAVLGRYLEGALVETLEMGLFTAVPALVLGLCVYAIGIATLERQHVRIEREGTKRTIVTTDEPFDQEDSRSVEVGSIDHLFLQEEKVPKQKAYSYGLLSAAVDKRLPEHDRKYHLKAHSEDGDVHPIRTDIVPRSNALAQQRLLASYLDLEAREDVVLEDEQLG